uniref:Uncharacterized protein n=1 Tax=Mus spicilegus TaxID=10103 RepID=A0A8C6GAD2_MUSSI
MDSASVDQKVLVQKLCLCLEEHRHTHQKDKETHRSQFSPSTMWMLRIELRSSGLSASPFIQLASFWWQELEGGGTFERSWQQSKKNKTLEDLDRSLLPDPPEWERLLPPSPAAVKSDLLLFLPCHNG